MRFCKYHWLKTVTHIMFDNSKTAECVWWYLVAHRKPMPADDCKGGRNKRNTCLGCTHPPVDSINFLLGLYSLPSTSLTPHHPVLLSEFLLAGVLCPITQPRPAAPAPRTYSTQIAGYSPVSCVVHEVERNFLHWNIGDMWQIPWNGIIYGTL